MQPSILQEVQYAKPDRPAPPERVAGYLHQLTLRHVQRGPRLQEGLQYRPELALGGGVLAGLYLNSAAVTEKPDTAPVDPHLAEIAALQAKIGAKNAALRLIASEAKSATD